MQPQYAQPQFSQPQYVQNPVHYAQSQFEPPQNIQYAPQPAAAYSAPVAQPHMYTPASYVSQPPAVTQPPPIYSMPSPGYPLQPQGQLMDAQPTPPVTHLPQPSAAQLVAPATDPAARALRGLARLRANPAVLKVSYCVAVCLAPFAVCLDGSRCQQRSLPNQLGSINFSWLCCSMLLSGREESACL